MNNQCRFILLLEYEGDDELIQAIATIEKNLPGYDYASRPLPIAGQKQGFKFVAVKELRRIATFEKFARKVFSLQSKTYGVRLIPGYVSHTNVVTAAYAPSAGAIFFDDELFLKAQLVLSGKVLASHTLSDETFRDRRTGLYLNDVWQLVKGATK
ncbi:hypothetical protein [Turneriella parva]|uniref:Uncharacterized protein n=1 Tax=Turneriella parva (strain ATCC BAA-1111 / DSM 21527 / NCTC 11395 / H) TaxID=869212 RepID=I4B5E1_TURPD|nr:hypothetical protein [Turneriella parva]AFM12498.1 hypothetical protein Turpa_1851 [Turneriella parva DSM 21527]